MCTQIPCNFLLGILSIPQVFLFFSEFNYWVRSDNEKNRINNLIQVGSFIIEKFSLDFSGTSYETLKQ